MSRWFVFLRAINIGSHRLTNEELLAPFARLGFEDVAAYQAAGNVTFRCADAAADDLVAEERIDAALSAAYGFDAPTFVRSRSEVDATIERQPFTPAELAATAGKVQVSFLRRAPSVDAIAGLSDLVPDTDLVRVIGREWFWLPVEGISTSELPVGQIESLLGAMTMRTLGTLQRMSTKFAD